MVEITAEEIAVAVGKGVKVRRIDRGQREWAAHAPLSGQDVDAAMARAKEMLLEALAEAVQRSGATQIGFNIWPEVGVVNGAARAYARGAC